MKKIIKEKFYTQVLHKLCGGEIILVASDKNDAVLCCKECKQTWDTSTNQIPFPQQMSIGEDMYIYYPEDMPL